ncbi:hypothetical protein EIP86_000041 [Pleurotus ostreatoroseus]|nr:hypothetical protein EIP86_000041 [Pleurotus ostreatoroseus]
MSKKENPLHSLFAGTTAGAIEAFITYPTEFVKTRSQFGGQRERPITIIRTTLQTKGITGLYSGCTALIIGTLTSSLVFEHFLMRVLWEQETRSRPASASSRMITSSTHSRTHRTKLIDDAKSPTPKYRGLVHGTMTIVREEGIRGIYRGLFPVSTARPGQQLPSSITFGIGAIAGLVTVYTTMPLDVIKTRMQSLTARQQYKNSFHCAYRIFTEEGILRFWNGTTPRLVRLMLSGGIVFTVYENIIKMISDNEGGL